MARVFCDSIMHPFAAALPNYSEPASLARCIDKTAGKRVDERVKKTLTHGLSPISLL